MSLRSSLPSLLLFVVAVLVGGHAQALPPDLAARGLDVFLHVSDTAVPGGRIEIVAKAYGFPSITQAVPLPSATIEAGWDPETLDGTAPPPNVLATTDGEGRARLGLDVPRGKAGKLGVLVAVRHGGHSRVRTLDVTRGTPARITIHTADTRVVPTSTISAWVRAVGPSEEPLVDRSVIVQLEEGGVARHTQTLRTDRGGLVMARVPIPRVDEPVWEWWLTAKLEGGDASVPVASLALQPREEIPGTPSLAVRWESPRSGARPGDKLPFAIRLRDATGQPVIDHAVRYWIGARGTTPPANEKEWEKLGTRATTNGGGEITGARDAPTLVGAKGTALVLVARSIVEGHALEERAGVEIGVGRASASLEAESAALVPGVSQKLHLSVVDSHGSGIAGDFEVTGDGLSTIVKTDERGEAELTWNAPLGVGANRDAGPCAGGVAAAVRIRPLRELDALRAQREPFVLCQSVDRDAAGIVRVTPNVARPGEKVLVVVERPPGAPRGSWSAILRARAHDHSVSAWLEARPDGSISGEVVVPASAPHGTWDLSVAQPESTRSARVLGAKVLVVPTVLPLLTAKRAGGRATPGGSVDVDVDLTDGHGKGLPGAVSTVVIDAFGGGRAEVGDLDVRASLCGELRIDAERCTAALERDPSTDAIRRALLQSRTPGLAPSNDPGAHASKEIETAFSEVLRSLEGAVFEASKKPQSLLDARRKENGRWVFNPELFTLVTASFDTPPSTPGGEHLSLADLVAVDPQVTFDNVARRVTRLKLFRVLAAVREFRLQKNADPEEPVFKDPNALLRRLVQRNALAAEMLLDPWGGTLQFVRGTTPAPPFLGTVRGWELRAPGPDGVVGTADDVRDPFERVVRSGSPYARAVKEDDIVDAKWDMVVSDDTVKAWEALFQEWTGTAIGDSFGAGGMGLSGIGEGGGGRGAGIGLGSIGTLGHGSGRGSSGIANGDAFWQPPVRTDASGHARITIPLGNAETTWRFAFVGVPDGLGPASTTLDVASELPLSVRVDAGARWVEGDVVVTKAFVRNRTAKPVRATVAAVAEDAVVLEEKQASRIVDVPAGGAKTVDLRVRATRPGIATLVVRAKADGLPEDVARHTWGVTPAGESRLFTRTSWVDGSVDLRIQLDDGYRLELQPRLVLERGYDDAVAHALDSLEPERQTSAHALLDAYETAVRIGRWATTKDSPRHRALAAIASGAAQRALGRHRSYAALDKLSGDASSPSRWALWMRAATWSGSGPSSARASGDEGDVRERCPPAWPAVQSAWGGGAFIDDDEVLDVEPTPSPSVPACWPAFVNNATNALMTDGDPEHLARAVIALSERTHRAPVAAALADRLRKLVKLDASGEVDLGKDTSNDRARRALVVAALLRAHALGTSKAKPEALFGQLAVLRDAQGGYGSSTATLAVVRALLGSQLEGRGATHVRIRAKGLDRELDVAEGSAEIVALPDATLDVAISTTGSGIVARLERPVLRLWSRPPPPLQGPVSIDVAWPTDAKSSRTSSLRVVLKHGRNAPSEIDARIPLPPGVTLGAPVKGAAQIQGVLALRTTVDQSATIEVPLRFGLAGTMRAPEASARLTRSTSNASVAPSRAVVVE
ncbi:MAG: hypothetical protein JST00_30340 [Deltaproteobacteria bacterium]|nr:hypothetical protein [Deltaproteobacteria bacterium]